MTEAPKVTDPAQFSRRRVLTGIGVVLGGAVAGGLGAGLATGKERAPLLEAPGTATVRWTVPTPIAAPDEVVVAGDSVLVGGQDTVVALESGTGAPRWQYGAPGPGASFVGLSVADGTVAVTAAGALTALDLATGKERWRQDIGFSRTVTAGPDAVYLGQGNMLYAFDAATGAERWTHEVSGYFTSYPLIDGSPTIAGDLVLAWDDKGVVAIDATSGTLRWHHPGHGYGAGVSGETVYVGGAEGYAALDIRSGAERWTARIELHTGPRPVPVADGALVLQDGDGCLRALDATTGMPRWGPVRWIPPRGPGAIAVSDPWWLSTSRPGSRYVYAGYPGGRVIAAEAATGMPTWIHELPAGSGMLTAMTVSDDIVYIAPEGGPVSAITA